MEAFVLFVPEKLVSVSIPSLSPKTVKKCDRPKILPYVQANELACHSFVGHSDWMGGPPNVGCPDWVGSCRVDGERIYPRQNK